MISKNHALISINHALILINHVMILSFPYSSLPFPNAIAHRLHRFSQIFKKLNRRFRGLTLIILRELSWFSCLKTSQSVKTVPSVASLANKSSAIICVICGFKLSILNFQLLLKSEVDKMHFVVKTPIFCPPISILLLSAAKKTQLSIFNSQFSIVQKSPISSVFFCPKIKRTKKEPKKNQN